jgi:hypothetical protein
MMCVHDEYVRRTLVGRRSMKALIKFFATNAINLPNGALILEMVTCTLNGLVLAIGGLRSTSNRPLAIGNFFTTQLSGFTFVSTILAGLVWSQLCNPTEQRPWTTCRKVKLALGLIIPLALDTMASLVMSVREVGHSLGETVASNIVAMAGGTVALMQLVAVAYFTNASVRFIIESRVQQTELGVLNFDARMDAFLRRLSWWTVGLGTSMTVYVFTLPITILPVFYTPSVWTACWSVGGLSKSIGSICRVNMLRSQRQRTRKSTSTKVSPSQKKLSVGATPSVSVR